MNRRLLRVALLLFGSGLTALVYQVAWIRELRLIFGFTTGASAAVVAIFLGGLGLGSWLLGRRADAAPRPLAFYGWLEIGVAAAAALTPLWVLLVRLAYIALGGTQSLGPVAGTLARLLLSALVLAVPTVLMGGTLPAAARAVETNEDSRRRFLAFLYGTNTLGAVAGTLLSNFLLIEWLGTRMTLWLACVVNALVGLAALRLSAAAPSEDPSRPPVKETREQNPSARFVLVAAFVVGFAFFLMELVWYRMLSPLLGGSTYTFGLILAVALAGIGAGSVACATGLARTATLSGFAASCAIEALFLALPYALGDRVAYLAILLRPLGALGFMGYVAGWVLVAGLVVFPAAFVAGVQFPLLIGLLGKGRERVGRDVGLGYAWNTAGGILGSLAGGFGLLPLLTATGTWIFVVVLLCALSLLALNEAGAGGKRMFLPVGAVAASILFLQATGPTAAWRHSPIGAGRVELPRASPNTLRDWRRERNRILVWQADGLEASVALMRGSAGFAFLINGRGDGSSLDDASTQVMSGLVGAALHPAPRRALVIGLGTGSTAGWLGAVPGIERVDVVEIEEAILPVARDCAPVNRNVLSNPKVRIHIADAREWLLTSRDRYDVIFSEPSNPFRAGVSSLFTEDFYRAVRERLQPGGIFLQWVQAYEVDGGTVRTVYATLHAAFPEVETWYTRPNDLLLVATREPIPYDVRALRKRLSEEPYVSGLRDAWHVAGLEGFLSHFLARGSAARELVPPGETPNSDDSNVIEFSFARSVGHDVSFDIEELRRLARLRHEDKPDISGGDVDWTAVNRWLVSTMTADGAPPALRGDLSAEEQRQILVQRAFLEGRPGNVLANWRAQPWEPQGQVEEVVLAEALAQGTEEKSLIYIERLKGSHPVEAEVLLARLRWRQGRLADATEAFERAFRLYRDDPWPMRLAVKNAFSIVLDIAGKDKALAARLFQALGPPFSVFVMEEDRRILRLGVASHLDSAQYAQAISEMEPNVPWRRAVLERRSQAYQATGNPLAPLARREFERFLKLEPRPFTKQMEPSAQPEGSAPPSPPASVP